MKVLLLNQTFHPDTMATGQYLNEVAIRLVERGHGVTVVTSRRAYDEPERVFPRRETWRGIEIRRARSSAFGKGAKWRRAADFATCTLACGLEVLRLSRHDVVVALTSPPLISFIGAVLARWWKARFFYWVMDFNPDEAIAAGWLREGSLAARLLEGLSRYSLRHATRVIALDRFMRDRITGKGIAPERVVVIPPWSHDDEVRFDPAGREEFRRMHGLTGKFVVMHSGNHSPCHPLTTLMQAAERLKSEPGIVFLFVGGGSELARVKEWSANLGLANVLCLPYQPLAELSRSLSAGDLQVVVLGDPFVGLIHPCKIYNILNVAAPVLYIGPEPSHLSEIAANLTGQHPCYCARHGDPDAVVQSIKEVRRLTTGARRGTPPDLTARFSKEVHLPRLIHELEATEARS